MKSVVRLVVVLLVVISSEGVRAAGAVGTGKILKIGGQVTGQASVYVGISPVPTGRAECNNNNSYQFVLDPTTDSGKALYSALLAAKSTEKRITIKGTGVCGLGQPMETVSYWILLD